MTIYRGYVGYRNDYSKKVQTTKVAESDDREVVRNALTNHPGAVVRFIMKSDPAAEEPVKF